MTYQETIKYLESFIDYEKIPSFAYKESLKLERIRGFLQTIGNPQDRLKCLHIAGSKGKGSTCAFLTYILREAGYSVGLYTSPHLSDFRERIRILMPNTEHQTAPACPASPADGRQAGLPAGQAGNTDFEGMITEKELAGLVEKMRPAIEKYSRVSQYGPLSFFEVYTALAFVYFQQKKVDFAVLETGLGGRLDATNVVNPLVCAIAPISYEHTQKLGNTLREIATEKVGIIKSEIQNPKSETNPKSLPVPARPAGGRQAGQIPNLIVISAPQEEEAMQVIRKKAKEVGAKLYEVRKDIQCRKTSRGFKVKGIFGTYSDLKIKLIGDHQIINAVVAIGAIEALQPYGITVEIDAIKKGLYNTIWPGRCEVISKKPLVVLDGAQNAASARILKETIQANFRYKKLILVLGISQDKDIKGVCNQLYGLADKVILTKANNPRASSPRDFVRYFNGKNISITQSVKEAKLVAKDKANIDDLILVTGSLFVVGEYRDDKT